MKRIFLILVFFISCVFANNAEKKIYHSVLSAFFPNYVAVKVWADDAEKREMLAGIDGVKIVKHVDDANILFIFHKKDIKSNKYKFVGSYSLLKRYKDDALGGFYWKKGRPNLFFVKENLNKNSIILPKKFTKYTDSRSEI